MHVADGVEWTLVFDGEWLVEEAVTVSGDRAYATLTEFEGSPVGRTIAPFIKDAIRRAAQDAG